MILHAGARTGEALAPSPRAPPEPGRQLHHPTPESGAATTPSTAGKCRAACPSRKRPAGRPSDGPEDLQKSESRVVACLGQVIRANSLPTDMTNYIILSLAVMIFFAGTAWRGPTLRKPKRRAGIVLCSVALAVLVVLPQGQCPLDLAGDDEPGEHQAGHIDVGILQIVMLRPGREGLAPVERGIEIQDQVAGDCQPRGEPDHVDPEPES